MRRRLQEDSAGPAFVSAKATEAEFPLEPPRAMLGWGGLWERLNLTLAMPVSGASLAVFRMAVGLVMTLEAYALVVPHDAAITSGTPLDHYYTGSDITFNFPYEGFEWLPLLPPIWMYGLVAVLALAGITMTIGLWYKASAVAVFSIWAYFFAVESTRTYWQSHFYLELLLTFLLIWMPAARTYSVDAWRSGHRWGCC